MSKFDEDIKNVSLVGEVSKEFMKDIPSLKRGEGEQLIDKVFSPLTFHFSRKRAATRIIRGVSGVTSDRLRVGVSFADTASARKFGFTLAEVLITLGIIGVVAAMTMPVLISKYKPKQTATKLKQTYSIMANAIKMAEVNEGSVSEWGLTGPDEQTAKIIMEKLRPYLKIAKECGLEDSNSECFYNGKYFTLNKSGPWTWANLATTSMKTYKIVLANGTSVLWHGNGTKKFNLFVDLNGSKAPNQFAKDMFELLRYNEGKLEIAGQDGWENYREYCLADNAPGFGCAYYVMTYEKTDYDK